MLNIYYSGGGGGVGDSGQETGGNKTIPPLLSSPRWREGRVAWEVVAGAVCVVCCLDLLMRELLHSNQGESIISCSSREGKETKISSNTFIISSVYSSRAVQEQYATILFKYNT